ncbi:MAG: HD domain-containing protein, partial [Campylobacterota bacterium]|nr:HD domain-containing protein [Campylobacterota bacterium]
KLNKYDLIITDINMPHMNGLEMSKQIKEINHKQSIIIISAYTDAHNFTESIDLGVDGYMIKPIDFQQMNKILLKVITNINETRLNIYYQNHLKVLVDLKTKESKELYTKSIENYKDTLYSLVSLIEQRDTYTGGHSQRVANYSKILAKKLGLNEKECENIYEAGILHDIGKVAIPDSILLKPSSLNEIEYHIIQSHVQIGYDMLFKVHMFKELVGAIESHHERYDGSGYPNGLKGEQIPFYARIMAVADSFDAMTTSRIYKGKKSVQESIDEIKSLSGISFCPKVVDVVDDLLSIKIDEDISQLPVSNIEQERFSYFYKDQVTGLYNKSYLDLIISQNSYTNTYKYINTIMLDNFNEYNKKNDWDEGDKLLKEFGLFLQNLYGENKIYRIHGDDFVMLSESKFEFKIKEMEEFISKYKILKIITRVKT